MNIGQKTIKKTFRPFLVIAFLLYSLFPHQFAFALIKDCGSHKIQACHEHEDSHLILTHEEEVSQKSDHTTPTSHDDSHQVKEKSYLRFTSVNEISTSSTFYFQVAITNYFEIPIQNIYKNLYIPLSHFSKSVNLFYLDTIRLLI